MLKAVAGASAILIAALIGAAPAAGEERLKLKFSDGPIPEAKAAPPVVARSGVLTQHAPGMPASAVPARNLAAGAVAIDNSAGTVTATATLGAVPDAGTDSFLAVLLGTLEGTTCMVDGIAGTETAGALEPGFARNGATFTYSGSGTYRTRDCAALALADTATGEELYDALVGPLDPTYGKPSLSITGVELLGKSQRKLKLVPGVWTKFDVGVLNAESATAPAENLAISGAGKGLQVRGATYEFGIDEGDDHSEEIEVKLSKKGKSKLKLVATADGVSAGKSLKVVAVKPPARPVDGQYVGDSSGIGFAIKNGKVTGFSGSFFTTCGGFPDFPTYANYPYGFPTTKIPRNGIVNAVERGEGPDYSVFLEMKVVGSKISQATFRYFGPNRCFAVDAFEAKRVKGAR